jgi:hypothetical protein
MKGQCTHGAGMAPPVLQAITFLETASSVQGDHFLRDPTAALPPVLLPGSSSSSSATGDHSLRPRRRAAFPPPLLHSFLCKLMSMQHNNLNLMTVTKRNSKVVLMFMNLYRLVSVFKDYFGELEERLLKPFNLHISHYLQAK